MSDCPKCAPHMAHDDKCRVIVRFGDSVISDVICGCEPHITVPVAALRGVVAQLDAEHRQDEWDNYGPRSACFMCWPKDGSWPCTTRLIADELRALIGDNK